MARRLTPREKLDRSISEDAWQSKVTDAASYNRWSWWHDQDSRKNKRGLPDLLLWKPHQFMACELKTETGIVTDDQARILREWEQAGVETHVWRPHDWDEVAARLRS